MTIDEAIQYAEDLGTEEESKIDYDKDSPHMIICRKNTVKDYRQLAEWLQDYKMLRGEYDNCQLNSIEDYRRETARCRSAYFKVNSELCHMKISLSECHKEIAEFKRLLKSATNVLNMFIPCDEDYNCSECIKQRRNCDYDDSFKWRYADEALALIGEDGDTP